MRAWAALGALALLAPALASAADARPSKAQAAAAVAEYKGVREGCAADDAACEGRARQRFVEVVSCVAQGKASVNPAKLQQDFARYVDLVSDVLDAPEAAPGAPAGPPCFGAAAAGAAPPAPPGAPAPAAAKPSGDEGPSLESLRRFRKQADEQSRPVTALPDTPDPSAHDKLKGDLEEIRGRLKSGVSGGGSTGGAAAVGGGGVAPGFAPAPTGVPAPVVGAPAPTGTTSITPGPSAPGTTNIGGGPTPPPAAGAAKSGAVVIPRPPGAINPAQLRQQILQPGGVVIQPAPVPTPTNCPKGMTLCGSRCQAVGNSCP